MGLFSKLFQSNEKNFVSPMTGKVVAMSDIPDPAFAQKMMGDGCGIGQSFKGSEIFLKISFFA